MLLQRQMVSENSTFNYYCLLNFLSFYPPAPLSCSGNKGNPPQRPIYKYPHTGLGAQGFGGTLQHTPMQFSQATPSPQLIQFSQATPSEQSSMFARGAQPGQTERGEHCLLFFFIFSLLIRLFPSFFLVFFSSLDWYVSISLSFLISFFLSLILSV